MDDRDSPISIIAFLILPEELFNVAVEGREQSGLPY